MNQSKEQTNIYWLCSFLKEYHVPLNFTWPLLLSNLVLKYSQGYMHSALAFTIQGYWQTS